MFDTVRFDIAGSTPMRGLSNGTGPQPEFIVIEHRLDDGSVMHEHQWRYPEPEPAPEDATASPASAETDPADAG
ncbi:hypothetical protein MHZ93_24275 [Roseomonas sp. ACRSG]|nr:hypothetical protein [Roseomonas sp. ACRSG]